MASLQSQTLKETAARYAVQHFVQPGMAIGLGSGSTAAFAVTALAERIASEGLRVGLIVATSADTEQLARAGGMDVTRDLTAAAGRLDVTIDGADEVDPDLNLIKGGGGALLREKLVAVQTDREVIVVDDSKLSRHLGERHTLPIMIARYAWETTAERVASVCGAAPLLRGAAAGQPFVSDDGLYCLDVPTGPIADAPALESRLKSITGVVDVGLFVGLAAALVVARADGSVDVTERTRAAGEREGAA